MQRLFVLGVTMLAVAAVACNNGSGSSSMTAPTTSVTTENFTGTVPVGGSDWHSFNVAQSNGQVNVILTAAGPPPTIYMGLGLGTVTGTTCTLISGGSIVTPAGLVAQLSGVAAAGAYCVQVYDAGNQTADISYAVSVSHY